MHPLQIALGGIGRRLIGGFRTSRPGRPPRSGHIGPSKYMPHIGKKERARHAGKPDGKEVL